MWGQRACWRVPNAKLEGFEGQLEGSEAQPEASEGQQKECEGQSKEYMLVLQF